MSSIIMNYFINEKKMGESVAKRMEEKLSRYDDIRDEFVKWIESKSYSSISPLIIEGYSPQMIAEMAPFLDGAGVYNFMVTLRENPEKAKEYIDSGFPRR